MSAPGEPAEGVEETPVLAKVNPETLVLRAKPQRAIRFRRWVIVALAATTSISIAATAWVALRPTTFHPVGQKDDRNDVGKAPADTLSGLPTGYGDAPKLGPPLPGDLGRPILEQQRSMATEAGVGKAPDQQAEQAAAAESERRLAELKAARESGLIVKSSTGVIEPVATSAGAPASQSEPGKPALNADRDPNAQARKLDFVAASDRAGPVNPHALARPLSPNTLAAGSVIAASLITGLRSDLPGLVTAQVTERVYDSATGRILLIPQGARLIGSYDSVVAFGQRRALVVWQRIILPDGSSLAIDNVPATDPGGYAGLADKVDFHTWSLLKGVALSTLLGVGSSLTFTGE